MLSEYAAVVTVDQCPIELNMFQSPAKHTRHCQAMANSQAKTPDFLHYFYVPVPENSLKNTLTVR